MTADLSQLLQQIDTPDELKRKLISEQVSFNRERAVDRDRRAWAGLVLGFVIALAVLAAAVYVATRGSGAQAAAGAVLGVGDLAALVTVFVLQDRRAAPAPAAEPTKP